MQKTVRGQQVRSFNAMIISRLDEEVLAQIDSEKFENAIGNSDAFIHNLIRFINNDCHVLKGPLIIDLSQEPPARYDYISPLSFVKCEIGIPVKSSICGDRILFNSKKIGIVNIRTNERELISSKEYQKRIKIDPTIDLANGNVIEFFEDYQYDPEVSQFLEPHKEHELYQFGTIYKSPNGREYITYLYWNGKCWRSGTKDNDGNYVLGGLVFIVKK